jgi:hypothetical protein
MLRLGYCCRLYKRKSNLDPAGGGQATSTAAGTCLSTTLVVMGHLYTDLASCFRSARSRYVATTSSVVA